MKIKNLDLVNAELALASKRLTEEQFPLFFKKVAFEALSRIVVRTPVDTGRARGNWQVTINDPAQGEAGDVDRAGSATISKGSVVINQATTGDVIWITNNVPYIVRLAEGWSKQAPAGAMIEVTLEELRQMVER